MLQIGLGVKGGRKEEVWVALGLLRSGTQENFRILIIHYSSTTKMERNTTNFLVQSIPVTLVVRLSSKQK